MGGSDANVIVLDPTGDGGREQGTLAPRLESLAGKKVAVLWNSKKNGDVVLRGVLAGLEAAGVEIAATWYQKMMFVPLDDQVLEEVVGKSEAAILALSD